MHKKLQQNKNYKIISIKILNCDYVYVCVHMYIYLYIYIADHKPLQVVFVTRLSSVHISFFCQIQWPLN